MTSAHQAADEAARELVRRCCECGVTVSTAESCTAGLVSSTIADIPGASGVLRGGAVTYVDEIKHAVLGVSLDTLERFTAVSAPCALEMAEGARKVFGSSLAVSTTGFAGPGGGTEEDPVGTVYFGLASDCGVRTECRRFEGTREDVRQAACLHALEMLLNAVEVG